MEALPLARVLHVPQLRKIVVVENRRLILIMRQLSGSAQQIALGPSAVDMDVTSSSRIASRGRIVTWAKSF
jgi:hypothetical protein